MTATERKNLRRRYRRNLRALFRLASVEDMHDGLTWYKRAPDECERRAEPYGISTRQFAGVIASRYGKFEGWGERPWHQHMHGDRKTTPARGRPVILWRAQRAVPVLDPS